MSADRPVSLSIPSDTAPSPIPLEVWSSVIARKPAAASDLFGAIVLDRRAAFLYYGLMACDAGTRAFYADHPRALKEIYETGAAAFAVAARSLHVRGAQVEIRGDTAEILGGVTARLQVARAGERNVLAEVPLVVEQTADPLKRSAACVVRVDRLPPGDYVVRVFVAAPGMTLERARAFRKSGTS